MDRDEVKREEIEAKIKVNEREQGELMDKLLLHDQLIRLAEEVYQIGIDTIKEVRGED